MLILFLFLQVAVVLSQAPRKHQRKIVGGIRTEIEDHPHQAFIAVIFTKDRQGCGGSIIDRTTILTAAHCIISPRLGYYLNSYIRVGSTNKLKGGQKIDVLIAIPHPDFNTHTLWNDIAILKLAKSIKYDYYVRPIALANFIPPVGSRVSVAGWGARAEADVKTPRLLYTLEMTIIQKKLCKEMYKGFVPIHRNTFCAGNVAGGNDTCQGDSGGPVLHQGQQIGLVSWGDGCGRKGKVGIYVDVTKYFVFILRTMRFYQKLYL